jgi:hypothetical protein
VKFEVVKTEEQKTLDEKKDTYGTYPPFEGSQLGPDLNVDPNLYLFHLFVIY